MCLECDQCDFATRRIAVLNKHMVGVHNQSKKERLRVKRRQGSDSHDNQLTGNLNGKQKRCKIRENAVLAKEGPEKSDKSTEDEESPQQRAEESEGHGNYQRQDRDRRPKKSAKTVKFTCEGCEQLFTRKELMEHKCLKCDKCEYATRRGQKVPF